ncbi:MULTISPECIES: dATP/dGTP diphosphohydrolase domain-containing protein [unclassified Beijerinckia]|uniref:dATP/dGTP diphosphohydrolase domain-containing protein n=1 Tax=unclassified Beijerinckia TaxID=2638183 RepID=UPI0008970DC4|nr:MULTISPECIES: dATP/dGTP diphosphohydrolase domain-containing protein [unclassified Beijerinckia]MDH7796455.1 hypothetical protein [Beijerinckia sp. GAS462]SEC45828.1 hypothetical protein SAMN05443249_2737 [Beijerinckia sp. 28-YEA-48]
MSTNALRYNNGKPRMSLVPSSLNRYVAFALTYGEQKYSAENWRKGFKWKSMIDSLERHLTDFKEGKDYDEESGLPMLSVIGCNIAFLIEHFDADLGEDDRWKHEGERKQLRFNSPPAKPGEEEIKLPADSKTIWELMEEDRLEKLDQPHVTLDKLRQYVMRTGAFPIPKPSPEDWFVDPNYKLDPGPWALDEGGGA